MMPVRGFRSCLSVVALALLGCGGPIFFVEVEAPEVCKVATGAALPGSPLLAGRTFESPDLPLNYDLTKMVPIPADSPLDPKIQMLSVTLIATSGVDDFSFIDTAAIRVSTTKTTTPVDLAVYQKGSAPASNRLVLAGAPDNDLVALLKEGNLSLLTKLKGSSPATNWAFDMSICMRASAKADYLKAAVEMNK